MKISTAFLLALSLPNASATDVCELAVLDPAIETYLKSNGVRKAEYEKILVFSGVMINRPHWPARESSSQVLIAALKNQGSDYVSGLPAVFLSNEGGLSVFKPGRNGSQVVRAENGRIYFSSVGQGGQPEWSSPRGEPLETLWTRPETPGYLRELLATLSRDQGILGEDLRWASVTPFQWEDREAWKLSVDSQNFNEVQAEGDVRPREYILTVEGYWTMEDLAAHLRPKLDFFRAGGYLYFKSTPEYVVETDPALTAASFYYSRPTILRQVRNEGREPLTKIRDPDFAGIKRATKDKLVRQLMTKSPDTFRRILISKPGFEGLDLKNLLAHEAVGGRDGRHYVILTLPRPSQQIWEPFLVAVVDLKSSVESTRLQFRRPQTLRLEDGGRLIGARLDGAEWKLCSTEEDVRALDQMRPSR